MELRFSVLMPTHNRADVLGFAIDSVLAQTESSFELLIVGDGCTDDTAKVVGRFKDSRIRWFDLPKAPYFGYANRNIALKQASGEFIAFAAHDDLLFPDHLATLLSQLEKTGAEWIYSRPLWVSPSGIVIPLSGNLNISDELESFLGVANFIPASCVVHRRSCFEKYGYWPEDVPSGADWRFWQRIIAGGSCKNFAYCPTPTTLHFKANWKSRIDQSIVSVASNLAIANCSDWWPETLKVSVDPRAPEQATFSRLLSDPSARWIEDARVAVITVIDRLASDFTRKFYDRQQSRQEFVVLESLLRQKDAQIAELTHKVVTSSSDPALTTPISWALMAPPEFDEELYLQANPDVAEAVRNGEYGLRSGFEHWLLTGRREHRLLRPICEKGI
jgi:glycosyltransferase involved in cell wall biosynthesis